MIVGSTNSLPGGFLGLRLSAAGWERNAPDAGRTAAETRRRKRTDERCHPRGLGFSSPARHNPRSSVTRRADPQECRLCPLH
jgi:hypothetical protein